MQTQPILLIDDCDETELLVRSSAPGFSIVSAKTIDDARKLIHKLQFSLFLVDVELPDGNGMEFCAELASEPKTALVPRVMLTSRDAVSEKVMGLYSGADDYITKPFIVQELRARIEARLRRQSQLQAAKQIIGDFEFDSEFQKCFDLKSEKPRDLELTPSEFRVFLALARKMGHPLTRQELVREVWQNNGLHIEPRGIDTHIVHLRRKLADQSDVITSVYGKGYAFSLQRSSI